MKKLTLLCLFFVFLLIPINCGAETAYTKYGEPGGIIVLSLSPEGVFWDAEAFLKDTLGNTISSNKGFFLYRTDSLKADIYLLLGIPSTTAPGEYTLQYTLHGPRKEEKTLPLQVRYRQFLSEDIPLDRNLTTLRSEPDPRKEEEAQEFIEIINTFSPSAVFATERHRLPVEKYITTSFFGDRRRYLYNDGTVAHSIHQGIDMAAPEGTEVHASGSGRVVFAGPRIITGNTVIIEHLPGVHGIYFHLHTLHVSRGDYVKKGEIIGTVGSTGLSTGNHLHWELRIRGVPVDPEIFTGEVILDKGAVFEENKPSIQ